MSPPSQSNPPFPVSRFAAAPSLTPSRWKNRDESASCVDPDILPYLDSVPIRLLPLLPPSQEASQCGTHCLTAATTAVPTQLPSPATPPPAIKPPSYISLPHMSTPASSPMPTPQQQTPTRRKPNFTFLPLLPVQETALSSEPPILPPPTPTNRFNMTFVPLLPLEDVSAVPPPVTVVTAPAETTPQNEVPPEEHTHQDEHEPEFVTSPPSTYMSLNFNGSCSSTPSLCSASDTESETPSVSSPCPSSPEENDATLSHYFEAGVTLAEAYDTGLHQHSVSVTSNHNPYFPAMPVGSSLPSHVLAEAAVVKKIQLQALPSPVLLPPSPLSLSPLGSEENEEGVKDGAETVTRGSPTKGAGSTMKRPFIPRPSSLSSLSSAVQGRDVLDAVSESLSALAMTGTPTLESPALETPELTIGTMRAPCYVRGPDGRSGGPQAVAGESILEPSIRRREV